MLSRGAARTTRNRRQHHLNVIAPTTWRPKDTTRGGLLRLPRILHRSDFTLRQPRPPLNLVSGRGISDDRIRRHIAECIKVRAVGVGISLRVIQFGRGRHCAKSAKQNEPSPLNSDTGRRWLAGWMECIEGYRGLGWSWHRQFESYLKQVHRMFMPLTMNIHPFRSCR